MERTARRLLDCVTRDKTISRYRCLALCDEQQRGLAPLHLLSMGEFAVIVGLCWRLKPADSKLQCLPDTCFLGSTITELVGDCCLLSLDLHFTRASAACNMQHAAACAVGSIICILCCMSSLSLIHPPCALAAAAAATAMLRCAVPYIPRLHPARARPFSPRLSNAAEIATGLPFDFIWKGRLSADGMVEEGVKRVGGGFGDMMRALQGLQDGGGDSGGGCVGGNEAGRGLKAALLDVQVCIVVAWLRLQLAR